VNRVRVVRVPASSANLGPGYDVLAAALAIHLELEVEETGEFGVEADLEGIPLDRSNLCVRAFESLHPADGLSFRISGEIPLARGLGSSAAAIVAALLAADHLYELGLGREEVYERAVALEGHPDNIAAALYGGFVLCPPAGGDGLERPVRLEPPQGVEAVLAIPFDEVSTTSARQALAERVPLGDAIAHVAAASQLVLGIERSDLALISQGLADRLHQPARAGLYPRSLELVSSARELGALGATISGAGPTVLVWCFYEQTCAVAEALREELDGWAKLLRTPFEHQGAFVDEL